MSETQEDIISRYDVVLKMDKNFDEGCYNLKQLKEHLENPMIMIDYLLNEHETKSREIILYAYAGGVDFKKSQYIESLREYEARYRKKYFEIMQYIWMLKDLY